MSPIPCDEIRQSGAVTPEQEGERGALRRADNKVEEDAEAGPDGDHDDEHDKEGSEGEEAVVPDEGGNPG
ncbi:hypothetical protein Q5P01_023596 [Channa striata]|uniref:Uncharacterized protein n=1 Tax=Channa striata TaxID=64152 RepID=A0AA88LQI3_CHASR|nr:hypothetical protein Q5P01_023596 [Channa striata]